MAGASNAYYELDPEGDLLLILRNPSPAFAVWDDNLGTLVDKLDPDSQKDEKKKKNKKKKAARATSSFSVDTQPLEELEPGQIASFYPATSTTPAHEAKGESQTLHTPPSTGEAAPEEPHLKLLLSSAHLRLGSGYFKRTLNHGWKEAVTRNADGKRCVEAEGFDAEALLTVMCMIHNLDNSVPENVDLEMMAKIAVVVDYYDCHEPVWSIASMWINELKEATLPTTCNRDLSLWLLVSSVFEEEEVFLKITEAAVLTSTGPLRTLDLPIRDILIDLIARRRQDAIGLLLTALKDAFDSLLKDMTDCSYECTSALLGALMKGASDLLLHSPEEPYLGYSIKWLEQALRNITTPMISTCVRRGSARYCSLENKIFDGLRGNLEKFKQGFELHQIPISDEVEKNGGVRVEEDQ